MAKKDAIARSLAPPFRIEPAALGFDSVFYLQLWVSFLSTLPSRLSLDAIRAPGPAFSFAVSPALMPGIFLLTFPKVITVPTPERKITVSLQGLVLSINMGKPVRILYVRPV